LPEFSSLNLYYTDPNNNLALAATETVVNGSFSAAVPANCVFAINGRQVPPESPSLQCTMGTNCFLLSWPGTATNFTLVTATNPLPNAVWSPVANSPQLLNGQFQQMVAPTNQPQFFRLRWP
jgi:hypothetical protein